MTRLAAALAIVSLVAACRQAPPAKEYELVGQILAVNPARQEVTIRHQDIKGFMPGMTMPFKVENADLLAGRQPGDLVRATLVVGEVQAYLSTLNVTGHAELTDAPPLVDAPQVLAPGQPVADALLVDENNQPMPLSSLRGHRVALTFIYTRCPLPDFCPLMERNFAAVQNTIKTSPELRDVRLVAVTMDPENDTPAVLKPHAQGLGADPKIWSFATGTPKEIQQFAEQFGVHVERDQQNGWQLIHNLRTAVIDADGTLVKIESGNMWMPADLVADLTKTSAPGH